MPATQGIGHLALTVTDVKRSAEFYNQIFDTQTVYDAEDDLGPMMVCANSTLMIGFRRHPTTGGADRFDPARVGMDHVGFNVADRAELVAWEQRLDEYGVPHSGIVEDPFGLHLNFKDPDNTALEFYVPPVAD